jgi:hypothetical protein
MRSNEPAASELRLARACACGLSAWLAWASPAQAEAPPRAPQAAAQLHGQASLSLGRGLRFNNPYRLAKPLGDTAESVSLSATYLDAGLAILFPAAPRLEHGAALDALVALDGIDQFGVTPSYLLQYNPDPHLRWHARLGLPIVVAPDASLGLEAALGPSVPIAYGLGLTAELVGSVFFGAATEQKSVTTIPMLALQLGIAFDDHVSW